MQRLNRLSGWFLMGWLFFTFAVCVAGDTDSSPVSTSTVGMPARLEQVVIPGSLLRARPLEDRHAPLVVRIVDAYPHGTDHRYDIEYYALEPGTYDLTETLERVDGSSVEDLPAIPVRVDSTLPEGQVVPSAVDEAGPGWIGGYRLALGLGAAAWLAGLAALVLVGRRSGEQAAVESQRELSLADRLEELIAAARDGTLARDRGAELERTVIAFWREELGLEHSNSSELLDQIRRDEEAAKMLDRISRWLHAPSFDGGVDLQGWLMPIERRVRERQATEPALSDGRGVAHTTASGTGEVTAR